MMDYSPAKLLYCGSKDSSDLSSWGPELRINYVIHYVISGKGFFQSGGKTYHVLAGQSFIIYPYTEVFYYPDLDDPWEYTWVDFAGEKCQHILSKTCFSENNCVTEKLAPEKLLPFYRLLIKVQRDRYTAEGLLMTILGVYADQFPAETVEQEEEYFTAAYHIIQSCYYKSDFCLAELCGQLGVSRTTLYRIFKRAAGVSPGMYLAKYRIECAKRLLERGAAVKSTAFSCGFSDPLYFSKAFSTLERLTPSEYRRLHAPKKV